MDASSKPVRAFRLAADASLVLALDGGKAYSDLIMLLVISHIPVFIIDSIVSVGVVLLLNKMYPTALSVVK